LHINTHVAIGSILSLIYSYFIDSFTVNIIVIFCISFLIDFDFVFSRYAKNRNHRVLPTHGIIIYLIILPIGIFLPVFYFISIAGVVHVLIDCLDWGVGILSPFSKKIYFGRLPKPPETVINEESLRKRQCWFTTTYYNSKFLLFLEILFMIFAIFTIFFIDIAYWWFLLIYFFFLGIHLYSLYNCKKQKDK